MSRMEWRILQMDTEEFDRTAGRLRESMPAGRYGVTSEQLASLRAIPHVTRRPPLNSKVQRQVVGLVAICALVIFWGGVAKQFPAGRAIPHVTRRPPLNSKVQRQVVGLFAICALVIPCVVVGMQFRP